MNANGRRTRRRIWPPFDVTILGALANDSGKRPVLTNWLANGLENAGKLSLASASSAVGRNVISKRHEFHGTRKTFDVIEKFRRRLE